MTAVSGINQQRFYD